MTRTVLRLHRTALIVWGAFVLGCVGGLVWLTEVTAGSVREAVAACEDAPGLCYLPVGSHYYEPMGWISTFMYYSFWAVAAWTGAALIGRELESGTAQLAWTQTVTPTRWLTAKLTLPALAIVLGGALFVPVFRWAWSANRDLMGDDWTFADVFAARGPAVVAYGLCALAIGALTAIVLRRPLPALGVSVAVMVLLNQYLEKHRTDLWPTRRSSGHSNSWWQVGKGTDSGGRYTIYHPPSHFWPMNLVETGILLAIAALATLIAFRLLRRRTA